MTDYQILVSRIIIKRQIARKLIGEQLPLTFGIEGKYSFKLDNDLVGLYINEGEVYITIPFYKRYYSSEEVRTGTPTVLAYLTDAEKALDEKIAEVKAIYDSVNIAPPMEGA